MADLHHSNKMGKQSLPGKSRIGKPVLCALSGPVSPMSATVSDSVRKKLITISTRKRPIHNHSSVLFLEGVEAIPPGRLFCGKGGQRILELGSGWGEFCVSWMENHPEDSYVAFEVKGDRIRRLTRNLDRREIGGVRILPVNFSWFLEELLPEKSFDWIIVNFPDPWPKKRHWKHRLVQGDFPDRMKRLLRPGGVIHLATDYGPYARKMLSLFRKRSDFAPVYPWPHYLRSRPANWPSTRFEEMQTEIGKIPYYQRWVLRHE